MTTTSKFRKSLFDFDFEAEAREKRFHDETIAAINFEEMSERVTALRKMSRRAFDENRMDVYFRIQDSLDSFASESTPAIAPVTTAVPAPEVTRPTPKAAKKTAKPAKAAASSKAAGYAIPKVRLSYVGDSSPKVKVSDSTVSYRLFKDSYEAGEIEMQEQFKVLYLNNSNKVLGIHTVSTGGITSTIVDPRIIFSGALLAHASAIILCHNHPSGALFPSLQDDNLTKKLCDGGSILGITVVDHIIVTTDGYYSYRDNGKF